MPSVPDPTLVLKPAMTVGIPEKSAVVEDDDDDDEVCVYIDLILA